MSDGFFRKLIQSHSGVSSKNFFLVCTTIIGMILLFVPAMVLVIEVLYQHTIQTDLVGLAAYIGSVSSLFAAAGITKVWSAKYENKSGKNCKNDEKLDD